MTVTYKLYITCQCHIPYFHKIIPYFNYKYSLKGRPRDYRLLITNLQSIKFINLYSIVQYQLG